MIKTINVKTKSRNEFVDITSDIQKVVEESGVKDGVCHVYVSHTTAGVTINEGADPSVADDIVATLGKLIPQNARYRHMEGNADAHVKASLMGASQSIFVEKGKLSLGTWQAVFFCEFDGSRNRRVTVTVVEG